MAIMNYWNGVAWIQLDAKNCETLDNKHASDFSLVADYIRQPAYGVVAGSANTYTFSSTPALTALVDGASAYVKINIANTGASTLNWNGLGAKNIMDSKGVALTAGKLPAGVIVGLRYNLSTTSFQLLGEGGGGNAVASDIMNLKTATTDAGLVTGSMPINGSMTDSISSNGGSKVIPAGHTSGGTVTSTTDADLVTGNIRSGVTIFGVGGKASVVETSDATATQPNRILSPYTAYADGSKITGSALPDPIVTLTAGSVFPVAIATAERLSANAGSYIKTREIQVNRIGTVRVSFDMKCSSNYSAKGKIYINGVAVGTERTNVSNTAYVTFTEDFTVSDGDLIQLYVYNTTSSSYGVYTMNFGIWVANSIPYATITL